METPDKIYLQQYGTDTVVFLNKYNIDEEWTEVPINDKAAKDIEYIRKDALISFLEKEKDDLYNWHFHDEDRKFKVYEEVIGKIKEL